MKKNMGSIGIRRAIAYIVLVFFSILCLFWFLLLFINSTRSNGELAGGFTLIPSKFFFINMKNVLTGSLPVVKGMWNSFFIATMSSILTVYFSTMTAYALTVYRFKGRTTILTFILAIMMIPTQVSALGFVNLVGNLGLEDSFVPLIVPAIASPITFFYMKQYMSANLPISLIEAARMDGAGEFKTFNMVTIPLMKPAIAVQMIFAFVASWNNYFIPSLILYRDDKKTLPILIAQLRAADYLKFDLGQVYAMIAFSIFPVIVVYLFLSKYIVGGVTAGGVKE